jgi:TolB protein
MRISYTNWLFWLLLTGLCVLHRPTPASAQGGGYIAFSSQRDGNEEIYLVHESRPNSEVNLSRHPARDWHPTWSPDGLRIAFVSNRDGSPDIYVMDANGQNQVNLSQSPRSEDLAPDWSPDGRYIAFVSNRDGAYDLYLHELQTGTVTRLTQDGIDKSAPAWFADSLQVAYWALRDGQPAIYSVDIQQKTRRLIAESPGDSWPAISPDGRKMAFERTIDGVKQIALLDLAPGGGITPFTSGPANHAQPAWANDSARMAVVSDREGDLDLYILDVASGGTRRLTSAPGPDLAPAWQPRPAPIPLLDEDGEFSLSQSFLRVQGDIPPEDVRVLGRSTARLVPEPPYRIAPDGLLTVRVEVEVMPDGTAILTPTVTAGGSTTNVGSATLTAYTYMRAQIIGIDLNKFEIYPSPDEDPYMLRLLPDQINFWEWQLRPKPEAIGKTNYLAVKFTLPDRLEDGTVQIRQEGDAVLRFEVRVDAGAPAAVGSGAASAHPAQNMRLHINGGDSLTLQLLQANVVDRVGVRTPRGDGWFDLDFGLRGSATRLDTGTCLMYARATASPTPAYPDGCSASLSRTLLIPYGDVFWWDFAAQRRANPLIILGASQVPCPDASPSCDF